MYYRALEKKETLKSTKLVGVFLGAGSIVFGIIGGYLPGIPVGILILIALLFKKEVYADEQGIWTYYLMPGFSHTETWLFEEIKYIHKEYSFKRPEAAALHFTKGAMSKVVLFRREDAPAIVEMALEANPEIYYDEVE